MNGVPIVRATFLTRGLLQLTLLTVLAAVTGPAAADETWTSTDGLYVLGFESEVEPLAINRLHRWTLTVTDRQGAPVEGASIVVTGGMPEHDHGLPTAPEVTRYLGGGRYLLEGMRFHMQGAWEISVSIDAADGSDTVELRLDISR